MSFCWDRVDRHRAVTVAAAAGVLAGILLAALGLPPVNAHGLLHFVGVMDPLCGGTRAVRLAFLGEWAQSWRYNPLGIPLAAGGVAALGRAMIGLCTHRWLTVRIRWRWWMLLAAGVAVVALQVRQQSIAELLLTTR